MPVDTEEVIEQIIEKHGETYIHKGVLQGRFEEVFGALSTENEELDRTVRALRRQLEDALARKRDVLVILGTFNWLQENIFSEDVFRDAIRDVFGQDLTAYRGLLGRLERLFSSKQLDEQGRLLPWKERHPDRVEFPGEDEQKPIFWCPECRLGFRDVDDLNRHTKSKCKYKEEEAFYKKRSAQEKTTSNEDASYCTICAYQAKNPGGLASHKRGAAHQKAEKKAMRANAKVHREADIKKTTKAPKKSRAKKVKKGKKK